MLDVCAINDNVQSTIRAWGGELNSKLTAGLSQAVVHCIAARLCLVFLLAAPVHAEPQSPFVAALGGVWTGSGSPVIPEVVSSSATGPVLVERGALPDVYGKFRAAFGSNGFDVQVTGGLDRDVAGGSIWTDGFVVTGGSGSGTLNLSTRIAGSVSGQAEMNYALFVSNQRFDLPTILDGVDASVGFWALQLPDAVRVLHSGVANRCGMSHASSECGHVPFENHQGPLEVTLTGSAPFTFGQTLYVASLFGGEVGAFGGTANFFNSATFGITAPAGATLASISGSQYVAAVPEPGAWVLFLAGACLLVVSGRRSLDAGTRHTPKAHHPQPRVPAT